MAKVLVIFRFNFVVIVEINTMPNAYYYCLDAESACMHAAAGTMLPAGTGTAGRHTEN